MPKSTRQTKSQDVYTRISVRLEHSEMSTDASINHDVHSPQYAIRQDDEDPLFKYMIRARWPPDTRHTLAGEIDKSGHPLIRGNGLDNCKPDFLVHLPGEMEGNYAAIEVKPVTAKRRDVVKDIETLIAFIDHGGYERGIYLFYGYSADGKGPAIAASELVAKGTHAHIEIWTHTAPNVAAFKYEAV